MGPISRAPLAISPHENRALLPTHTGDCWVSDLFEKAGPELLGLATEESASSAQPFLSQSRFQEKTRQWKSQAPGDRESRIR